MTNPERYAEIIIEDNREQIASEETIEYSPHRIERLYTFDDGAVVRYEWQDLPGGGRTAESERYNHRFMLIETPSPNPKGFEKGVIKVINYPT